VRPGAAGLSCQRFRLKPGASLVVAIITILVVAIANPAIAQSAHGRAATIVHFAPASGQPKLLGYLRQPAGRGPFAAVVLLHGCGGDAEGLDRNWGTRLWSWGYVTLTVDSFTPRGITNSCHTGAPAGRVLDPYTALGYLSGLAAVDSSRIALMGFSEGGIIALTDIEPQAAKPAGSLRFRAAIAVYPTCAGSGVTTMPTLIINGQLDDWSSADACRKMVAQESDIGITRHKGPSAPIHLTIIPGAYHKFDDPKFQPGHRYMGHLLAYNSAALKLAAENVRNFLHEQLAKP
jgi:dienelactone hydrolase